MKHARADYDRIQDPAGKIPADEPVFLLRAQDRLACQAVAYYARLCQDTQAPEVAALAIAHSKAMRDWPVKKVPDLPAEVVNWGGWVGCCPDATPTPDLTPGGPLERAVVANFNEALLDVPPFVEPRPAPPTCPVDEPCPFCGCADTIESSNGEGSHFLNCLHCGSEGPPGNTPAEARRRWNRRGVGRDSAAAKPVTVDDVAEAMRKRFVKLQRYSFHTDGAAGVRRVPDRYGNWVEFSAAHEQFDPVHVDAALKDAGVAAQAAPSPAPAELLRAALQALQCMRQMLSGGEWYEPARKADELADAIVAAGGKVPL